MAALTLAFVSVVSASVGPLVLASGPSPFAACTIGGTPDSVNYVNSEVEPSGRVNPTNSNNRIGVYQQDRWNDGGAHGRVAAVTHNGGLTWTHTWAAFSLCSGGTVANGGDFERATDPLGHFSPNGAAYQISVSFNALNPDNAVLVSKSTNGGDTLERRRDAHPESVGLQLQRHKGIDHRRPDELELRIRGAGSLPASGWRAERQRVPLLRLPRRSVLRAHDERRRELGAGAEHVQAKREPVDDRAPNRRPAKRHADRRLQPVPRLGCAAVEPELAGSHALDGQGRDVVGSNPDRQGLRRRHPRPDIRAG